MNLLHSMVGTVQQLDWLVAALVNEVGEWPGPKELKAIYCTHFKPVDGVEVDCTTRGFTGADCERQNMLAAPAVLKCLVPADDDLRSPEDRRAIDELAEKLKLRAARKHGLKRPKPNKSPAWLENLS